jgi:uncharacterized membrane protein YvlD (DUF360 family)
MSYFKSLLFNFLAVFFVNHVIPGIEIGYYSKLPEVKGDFIFSIAVGFLMSLVFPVLKALPIKPSHFKIGLITFFISFVAYSIVNVLPLDIQIVHKGAYIWCSLIVWFCGYLTNHLEYRAYLKELENKEEDK